MKRFKNILCVVVSDSKGGAALNRAAMLAENNQASLTIVEVIDEIPSNTKFLDHLPSSEALQATRVNEHQQRLEELAAPWRNNIDIQINVLSGTPFLEIISDVLRNNRDLVIKTAESGGLLDRVFGSNDMHLLRKCPCPVWLAKPESPNSYQRILAAVDVDDDYPLEELNARHQLNRQILEMASSLALSEFAELHIVHAWEAIGESAMRRFFVDVPEEEISVYIDEVRQQHGENLNVLISEVMNQAEQHTLDYLTPKIHQPRGLPRKEVPALAERIEADLVVMGTVARTGISGLFMGNTAETILNRLNCSVLAIKPPGFVTPVIIDD